MDKSTVTIECCPDYDPANVERAVRSALEPLGGMAALLDDAQRIVLKPNLVAAHQAEQAATTHFTVVEAVAKLILETGDRTIAIADSPAIGSVRRVARRCGVMEVAKRLGLEIWKINQTARVPLPPGENEWPHMLIDRRLVEPGTCVINLPKAKVHSQMYVTLAIKNLFGVIGGHRKPMWHISTDGDRRRFGRMLIWMHRLIGPAVHIIDAVDGMERRGPRHGDPRRVGVIAASTDVSALDRVITEILGLDPSKHHALESARELGHGACDLDQIEIIGETIDAVRVSGFKRSPVYDLCFGIP